MKLLFFFLFSLSYSAQASYPELFGSSAGSMAIGNQAELESAANNHYSSALLGFSEKTQFSFNTFYVHSDFREINNVVIENETNTVNDFNEGDVETTPTSTLMFGLHLSTPLFSPEGPKFNVSAFAPFDRLMEADTGDPYQPRYVMYENRFIRPTFILSAAQAFGPWSASIGAITGLQSNGETHLVTKDTGNGSPSVGKISFNAKPSLGVIASIARKVKDQTTYLSFQQEMKSKLVNEASGETDIGGNGTFPYDLKVSSILYYDPMTLRLGHQIRSDSSNLLLSLEYQHWKTYEASTLKIKQQGGQINGSDDHEKLKLRNIFIPKIGYELKINEYWTWKSGYFYRPSPLKTNNLKNAGNSIDVEKHVVSQGIGHKFKLFQKDITFDFAYQLHLLRSQKITKTPNREDGDPSEPKIGSPGYRVGGMIHALSMGLTWKY